MFDLLIHNGRICDGSGAPSFLGSLAIRGGRVAAVGRDLPPAARALDAGGAVVAPGFIDPHTHFDAQLTWDGLAQPSLEHGVTAVIPGNCSLSLAPLRREHRELLGAMFRQIEEMPKSAFDAGLRWSWESFGEYLAALRGTLGLHVAPLVGHSLLRLFALGEQSRVRASSPAEVAVLQDLLRASLDAGAAGLSTSFVDVDHEFRPVPCRLGSMGELRALCAVLGERGRPLQVVPEFWDEDLLRTRIDQLARISLDFGIPVTFSPLFESVSTPTLVARALERLELQAARGARVIAQMQTRPIDITFDLSQPSAVFSAMPTWFGTLMQPEAALRAALRDAGHRAKLVAESKTDARPIALDFELSRVRLSAAWGRAKDDVGRTLAEIGRERGLEPAEALIEISLEEELRARFTAANLAHDDAARIAPSLRHPQVQIGAGDGGAHVARFATCGDTGYLFSRFVRELRALSVEEAVRRLTSDIAEAWGLAGRGHLAPGCAADLVIFDPAVIDRGPEELAFDLPGGGESFRFVRRGRGIREVFVNGESVYEASRGYSAARPGEVLSGAGARAGGPA